MSAPRKRGRAEPTWTSLVLAALVRADDFMSMKQIAAAVSTADLRLVRITLLWLRGFHAVDSVVSEGRPWWFATPENDTRTKHLDLRVPEERKRAPRRARGTIIKKEPS